MLRIRRAVLADAPLIARIHVESWRSSYAGIVPEHYLRELSIPDRSKTWADALTGKAGQAPETILVASEEDTVTGFIAGGPARESMEGFGGEIYAIYIDSAFQRKGIGGRLVLRMAQELKDLGFNKMVLWVLAANKCRRFYETLGGTLAGSHTVNIGGAPVAGVAYAWDDLTGLIARMRREGNDARDFK